MASASPVESTDHFASVSHAELLAPMESPSDSVKLHLAVTMVITEYRCHLRAVPAVAGKLNTHAGINYRLVIHGLSPCGAASPPLAPEIASCGTLVHRAAFCRA